MNDRHQETLADIHQSEFGGPASSKERKILHFSSGETLEVEDSEEEEEEEEEEQSSDRSPFKEPAERTRFSFKAMALLVGRISLLTCDFLGARLAGALGLNAAKYQYAIDQHYRDHKTTSNRGEGDLVKGQAEMTHLTPGLDGNHYGATGDSSCASEPTESCGEKHLERKEGRHNRGYEADQHHLK
ncbi:protein FAM177B [Brachyistius frenatus]|uniref:protein FAM177B n=1 Tax=Brachyistius frenatus TaxID=100188 RepID=UPI0037E7CD54